MRIDGMEHLERARAGGGGVIVAAVHLGPLWALYTGLGERGVKLYILGWRPVKITTGTISGPTAPYTMAQAARVEAAGGKVVPKGNSYPVLRELLNRGEVIFNALDIPSTGQGPVTKLGGRQVRLATGTAALGKETDAPIVPIYGMRDGGKPAARVLPPIDPGDFANRDALHVHLAELSDGILTANAGHLNSMFFDLLRMAIVEES
jgi:lauroyl/myristoyl acyltransferase